MEIDVEKESAHEDDDKDQSDDENEVWEVTGVLAILGWLECLLHLEQLLLLINFLSLLSRRPPAARACRFFTLEGDLTGCTTTDKSAGGRAISFSQEMKWEDSWFRCKLVWKNHANVKGVRHLSGNL